MKRLVLLIFSHLIFGFGGFALGIYTLPILTAEPPADESEIENISKTAEFTGEFVKDLKDSDFLHWGEGKVSISNEHITLMGELAPGPDYRLYLSPEFVETEAAFERLKPSMIQIADIKTFKNFVIPVPNGINVAGYNSVIIWCERFGEFITAAQYQTTP